MSAEYSVSSDTMMQRGLFISGFMHYNIVDKRPPESPHPHKVDSEAESAKVMLRMYLMNTPSKNSLAQKLSVTHVILLPEKVTTPTSSQFT